ncbi:MAG: hypothetical protein QMD65_03090 [Patescibacteria group bacterium]|nr:hypothetical protein [Patescibacteria group bacterium]
MEEGLKRKRMPAFQKRIFIICPVRHISEEVRKTIEKYVAQKEKEGSEVYWPFRDTDQNDAVGFRICCDNGRAIFRADEVHIWYDKESQGSIFDVGMLFMASIIIGPKKKVVIINRKDVKFTDGKKSFNNVLLALSAKEKINTPK